ncbi:DUF4124 domain-containing protein [Chitinolyticbacter albus]|uniref:DUF4124 domain-containing protein n=1 Tax=Chitinolyticbacter albus TaxID=2961951 RepID=UPI00210F1648|nr:DUF4124 domain-containing protein [Chitinolyticbacter albus]
MKLLFVLLLIVATTDAVAEVYKCREADGKVSYSDQPCSGSRLQFQPGSVSEATGYRPTPTPQGMAQPEPTATPLPEPPPASAQKRVDPDAPMTENCSADNPDRDPEFCRPGNLNNVYGEPDRRPRLRPRPRPH